jgi:tetratricopeptide (TPR) repeat protein
MKLIQKLVFAALVAVCLSGGPSTASAAGQTAPASSRAHPAPGSKCPSPDELNTALRHASSEMEQAQYQEAAATLQPLAPLNCDARISLLLAAALEGNGNIPGAQQVLIKAHSTWPSNTSIQASLAREYLASKQIQKAVDALVHFHATATTPPQELELATIVFLAGHQLISAQAVAEVAYKAYPSVHSLVLLANTLQLQGRFKEVNRLLGDQRNQYSQSPEFLITLAESEYDAVLYDTAREDLEHAIALDNNSYQAHFLLGNVIFKLNDVDKAIAEYRQAIKLAPDRPRAYYQLALALQTKQDEAGEEELLQQALAIDNHYAPAHVEMGRILISQNHLPDAVAQLNQAIADNPSSEQAYFQLARAYAQLGDKEKSAAMQKRLVEVRNQNWRNAGDKSRGESPHDSSTTP